MRGVLACLGIELLPEFQQQLRAVAAEPETPDGIVRVVKERGQTGQPSDLMEDVVKIFPITLRRVLAEIKRVLVARQSEPFAGAGSHGG